MTPRRLAGFLHLANRRERQGRADDLSLAATAASAPYAKKGEMKKIIDAMTKHD